MKCQHALESSGGKLIKRGLKEYRERRRFPSVTLVDGGNLLVALQDLQTTLKGNVEVPIIDTDFGSHNICYVTWANSPALIIRLVWQSSLATLPFRR